MKNTIDWLDSCITDCYKEIDRQNAEIDKLIKLKGEVSSENMLDEIYFPGLKDKLNKIGVQD